MSSPSSNELQIPDVPLLTLSFLNAALPPEVDVRKTAQDWFSAFTASADSQNSQATANLFVPDSFWRDILALTWDFRTFRGQEMISQFLRDRLPLIKFFNVKLREDEFLRLQQPYPDLAWINAMFDFETGIGIGSGVVRLVPTQSGTWKAQVVFTNLENLKGFPEAIGPLRDSQPDSGFWVQKRQRDAEFEDTNPTVLIIGAGQSGLELAVRLRALGVSALLIERNSRVGDNWRNRYEALCLHDPVWYDHMAYIPFPPAWPVYTPAQKLANWLEHYADIMEIPVWTSSNITQCRQDEDNKWHISISRGDRVTERQLIVNHLVFATGFGGSMPTPYHYPGLENFRGQHLHSTTHKRAMDHAGKRVVIVGACTSAHDIAVDYFNHGIDVTMVQRGPTYVMSCKHGWETVFKGLYWEDGPPVDIADRLAASTPVFMSTKYQQRKIREIAELDKEILDGLRSVGFKLTDGIMGTGFSLLARTKAGGFYLDTGACQLIIDKKIKLKNSSSISEVTETGLKFEDGSVLEADVIVFATGLGSIRDAIRSVCGDDIANRIKEIWGLDSEGEINGAWRDIGVPNMWYMMGNLAQARFHSKHLALQIKAIEEGIFGKRYSS